jgi:hypothetical protein
MAPGSANRTKAGLVRLLIGSAFIVAQVQAVFADNLRRLVFQETIEISRCERFVASDEFSVGRSIGNRSLGSVSFNFARLFLAATETDAYPFPLQAWTLRYSADDSSLIARLGGEERVVLPLCSIYRLMEMNSRAESVTDARSNFAYARSPVDHRLMAIHWFVNERNQWAIGAVEVPHPELDWPTGSRVYSKAIVAAEDKSR